MWQNPRNAVFYPRMKTRLLLAVIATCFAAPLHADDTPLGKQMEEFNDAYKALRREEDPAKAAALTREAQQAVVKSLSELPSMVGKMPEGPEKAKAAAEYRLMMGKVYVTLCEIEAASLAGEMDKVAELVKGLRTAKKEGHDKFMEE